MTHDLIWAALAFACWMGGAEFTRWQYRRAYRRAIAVRDGDTANGATVSALVEGLAERCKRSE